jgi:hypothetical protein
MCDWTSPMLPALDNKQAMLSSVNVHQTTLAHHVNVVLLVSIGLNKVHILGRVFHVTVKDVLTDVIPSRVPVRTVVTTLLDLSVWRVDAVTSMTPTVELARSVHVHCHLNQTILHTPVK